MNDSTYASILEFGHAPLKVINHFLSLFHEKTLSQALKDLLSRKDHLHCYLFENPTNCIQWNMPLLDVENVEELRNMLILLDDFMWRSRLDSRAAAIELLMLCKKNDTRDAFVQTDGPEAPDAINYGDVGQEEGCSGELREFTKDCHKQNGFTCDICTEIFSCRDLLQEHTRLHCRNEKASPTKQSSRSLESNQHISHDKKSFTCKICGKSLSAKRHLENHVKTHEKKQHVCDKCGKSFTLLRGLRLHMKVHSGERPYVCDVCGQSYMRYVHLRDHLTLHTGEKRYKCKFCGRPFRKFCSKLKHERIHAGIKPFICTLCDHKGFTQKYNLTSHLKKFHKLDVNGVLPQV